MEGSSESAPGRGSLSVHELVRSALETKLSAISGYDDIIWKIRAGYAAILYGSLALIIGTKGVELNSIARDSMLAASIMLLVLGFSIAAFFVDFGYLRKKLKVVVVRNALIEMVLINPANWENDSALQRYLQISGEADINDRTFFPCRILSEYRRQLRWNLRWIHVPLYTSAPLVIFIIWLLH